MEPVGETKEQETEPVLEASSYGGAKRTGNNLGYCKEICAKQDPLESNVDRLMLHKELRSLKKKETL